MRGGNLSIVHIYAMIAPARRAIFRLNEFVYVE